MSYPIHRARISRTRLTILRAMALFIVLCGALLIASSFCGDTERQSREEQENDGSREGTQTKPPHKER